MRHVSNNRLTEILVAVCCAIAVCLLLSTMLIEDWMPMKSTLNNVHVDDAQGHVLEDVELAERLAAIGHHEHYLSLKLSESVRFLCLVITSLTRTNAQDAIRQTWGRKCGLLVFVVADQPAPDMFGNQFSQKQSPYHTRVAENGIMLHLDIGAEDDFRWTRLLIALVYVHDHFTDTFDWIMRIDDTAFVFVENLQMMLLTRRVDNNEIYGLHISANGGFISSSTGITMSRTSLGTLIAFMRTPEIATAVDGCSLQSTALDDVALAACARQAGLTIGLTHDGKKTRYFPMDLTAAIHDEYRPDGLDQYTVHAVEPGLMCCSDTFIAVGNVSPELMRVYELLVYFVHPFSQRSSWPGVNLYFDDVDVEVLKQQNSLYSQESNQQDNNDQNVNTFDYESIQSFDDNGVEVNGYNEAAGMAGDEKPQITDGVFPVQTDQISTVLPQFGQVVEVAPADVTALLVAEIATTESVFESSQTDNYIQFAPLVDSATEIDTEQLSTFSEDGQEVLKMEDDMMKQIDHL